MDSLFGIVWIIWTIALLILYHKCFEVYYFSLGNGLVKELVAAAFLGIIMTGLTFYLWWLTAIIIIIIGLLFMGKTNSKAPLVIAIILAIVISIMGINVKNDSSSSEPSATNISQTE
ncbi:MAG: hypothetical protein IKY23_10205 [Lachnospiraceae bacterium]|nr:hypothetical protein [Lachnospiraceae bacterium]